jgi:L-serine/L-threonine ammonia-lyase
MLDEVAEETSAPDAVVVAVGGGGLLCGVLEGMHRAGWEKTPVFAAETIGAASYHAALTQGGPVDIGAVTSLATTLGARRVCAEAYAWSQRHQISSVVVSDAQAAAACIAFANEERMLVELACGAALAVARDHAALKGAERILVIVCGGAGATLDKLREWHETAACAGAP